MQYDLDGATVPCYHFIWKTVYCEDVEDVADARELRSNIRGLAREVTLVCGDCVVDHSQFSVGECERLPDLGRIGRQTCSFQVVLACKGPRAHELVDFSEAMPRSEIARVDFNGTAVHLHCCGRILDLDVAVAQEDPCAERIRIELDGSFEGLDCARLVCLIVEVVSNDAADFGRLGPPFGRCMCEVGELFAAIGEEECVGVIGQAFDEERIDFARLLEEFDGRFEI